MNLSAVWEHVQSGLVNSVRADLGRGDIHISCVRSMTGFALGITVATSNGARTFALTDVTAAGLGAGVLRELQRLCKQEVQRIDQQHANKIKHDEFEAIRKQQRAARRARRAENRLRRQQASAAPLKSGPRALMLAGDIPTGD